MYEKILIVDNDPEMLMLLGMLVREGTPHEPEATNNPLEALELVKQGGIALVITELKMPALDGIELLEAVRRIDQDVPVVIMSSYGAVETAMEAMYKGAFDYITKPFRKEHMLYTIDRASKWVTVQRENRMLREQLKERCAVL